MKVFSVFALLWFCCLTLQAQEALVVAHRGASKDAPENTIPAFELAWQQGADAIEGDFHLSHDGHIVCVHDKNTKEVANRNLVIKDSTWDELKTLDVGARHGEKFKGVGIPRIADVFATVPVGKKIYIEVKCGVEIVTKLLEEIQKSGLKQEQIIVISFHKEVISEIKAKAPQFKAYWLVSFKRRFGTTRPSHREVLADLEQINADGLSSSKNHVDDAFIRKVIDRGFEHHVWTVDDAATAKRFQQWGTRSITTNVPGVIKQELDNS